jgi:cellulose synthase/poly-beta-1,6-N-acetylglucosamine synthase-like glycosyltransferase
VNLAVGLYSLVASVRHHRRLSEPATPSPRGGYRPAVCLIVPCCGDEEGLEENLIALTRQDYRPCNLVFAVEAANDPAVTVIERVRARAELEAELVVAGGAADRGQKVHNLLAALDRAAGAEVLAFADSDGRPDRGWLARLVSRLEPERVGAVTGYRFYLPAPGSPASLARSVWNAGVLTLLGEHGRNFAWGGSMAIRTDVFEKARVREAWQGALSDDYALTHAVRAAGYQIRFVPSCLVPSRGRVGWGELLSWCSRQMAITRVYWPGLWRIAGAAQLLHLGFLVAGTAAALAGDRVLASWVVLVLLLSVSSGWTRAYSVSRLAPAWREEIRPYRWAYGLWAPVASVLTAYCFARSALSRKIAWRGKRYEMRSPTETVVLGAG